MQIAKWSEKTILVLVRSERKAYRCRRYSARASRVASSGRIGSNKSSVETLTKSSGRTNKDWNTDKASLPNILRVGDVTFRNAIFFEGAM